MLTQWRHFARRLKTETCALFFAYRDPRTSWYAKIFVGLVVAYAFSPLDLIPDFIPVLGYLDDLLLLPLGIWLVIKMIPPQVLIESRQEAEKQNELPTNYGAAVVIVLLWILSAALVSAWAWQLFAAR